MPRQAAIIRAKNAGRKINANNAPLLVEEKSAADRRGKGGNTIPTRMHGARGTEDDNK
jgi:hypothetical protein